MDLLPFMASLLGFTFNWPVGDAKFGAKCYKTVLAMSIAF
jgi:hypothetical protein